MVPEIEELSSELESGTAFFIYENVLEQRDVPIVATGSAHTVMQFVAPSSRGWRGKNGSVEPFIDGMRIDHSPVSVWTIGGIGDDVCDVWSG